MRDLRSRFAYGEIAALLRELRLPMSAYASLYRQLAGVDGVSVARAKLIAKASKGRVKWTDFFTEERV
jgi:hypothetical protein